MAAPQGRPLAGEREKRGLPFRWLQISCSPVPRNREVLFVKVIRGLSKLVHTDPTPQVCLMNARRATR